MRLLRPRAPFWLGGEYLLRGAAHFLRDFESAIEFSGVEVQATSGDLLRIRVVKNGDKLTIDRCEVVHRRIGESLTGFDHALGFTRFVNEVRSYLLEIGLQEVFTPSLVPCPGLEPSLEPFATQLTRGRGSLEVYLPTSPEIHLKKAMSLGLTDIFEIKPCFRRGEFSPHHENEFLMLEWYRGFADLDLIIEDLRGMVKADLAVTDFAALFREELGFELRPETSTEELLALCKRLDLHTHESDTFTDLFHRLMIEKIEPAMEKRGPLIVRRFPPAMAALARLIEPGWADRFEFYWNGLEIANAFNEVTDPQEQRKRWQAEQAERARLGTTPLPQDEALIRAFENGLPPTGGIALGLERLYMATHGVKDIRELRLFSANDLLK
jgi:lysyl-tRNA synthetase class 2